MTIRFIFRVEILPEHCRVRASGAVHRGSEQTPQRQRRRELPPSERKQVSSR